MSDLAILSKVGSKSYLLIISILKKEYRVGLEREIVELEGLVENLEWVIDELEGTSQVQDMVQVEVRDRGEIDKEIKDAINK